MKIDYQRNQEIEQSLKVGARAFAVGAVLILALSVTGMHNPNSGDAILGIASTPAVVSDASAGAASPDAATATTRIDVPFRSNQGDVEELPPQF
ncbi:MAG: hypothetical protein ABI881_14570 [Betaproteobacteria bacterium]